MPVKEKARATARPKKRNGKEKSTRELLLAAADILPGNATLLQAIDCLLTFAAIERGLADVRAGRVIPAEKAFENLRRKYKIPRST